MALRPRDRRLLLVHAHPDDESIETGATMARYAAEGVHVTLVTCTLGELGEIIPPQLGHLDPHQLGKHRIGELARACAELGVADHRFLGGPGRWRDSGMMGLESNDAPGCFWQADVAQAASELAAVLRELRPQVVVSYDENGFYGHPDHIQAHRVTRQAFTGSGLAGLGAKFYATAVPRSVLAQAIRLPPGAPAGFRAVSVEELPYGVADEQVTTEIDGTAYLAAKTAAMRAHATQIHVADGCYALSNGVGQRIWGREYYTLLAGPGGGGPGGLERDLFAGL